MISFYNVTKTYPSHSDRQPICALKDVTFQVKPKEFVLVVGRSGAGKTTLLKLLLMEEKPTQGKIFFEGQDLSQINPRDFPKFRQKFGVVFQDYKLLSSKNVRENIAFLMEAMGKNDREVARDVAQVLEIVELTERADSFPVELSGGERQRLALARALIHRPQVILADEPTGNLDPYYSREIVDLLAKINSMGTTLILATHNKEIVNFLNKRVITLEKGEIIKDEKKGRFIL